MMKLYLLLVLLITWSGCESIQNESVPEPENIAVPEGSSDGTEEETFVVQPIALIPAALGELERSITTTSPEAQAFFNQGLQLKYAFAVDESASSFREAQKLDEECAMCYWGEAWALGSYLNQHMSKSKAPLAWSAIQKAADLAPSHADEKEKALINAMTIRYVEDYVYDERRNQDSLFAIAMNEVYNQFPEDPDIATVYAESLFLLEPRRGTREMDNPRLMTIHQVLERVLAGGVMHPGACHLYIHATESTDQPQLGEPCADYLGNAIPGASHINHMPSHTWNEVGRWGESVRANLQAWHTDLKADLGEAIAIYPTHNLHMLLFSASYDGQGAIATQAGKDFAKRTGNSMFQVITLIRFGRFDEVLEVNDRPKADIPGGYWDFAQGYARLKNGEPDFAKLYLERVLNTADTSDDEYRWHGADQILGVLAAVLEGEIHREDGDLQKAIGSFQRAVQIEDGFPYDEPEPLPFSARHWLGDALLEAGRYAEAEGVYRAELADHPHNGWSLFGLMEALSAQSKDYNSEQKDFEASWTRSDTWLRSSRF